MINKNQEIEWNFDGFMKQWFYLLPTNILWLLKFDKYLVPTARISMNLWYHT